MNVIHWFLILILLILVPWLLTHRARLAGGEGKQNGMQPMTPRPFYRSRLFWLGLFVFSFLLWSWKDSGNHVTWISHSGVSFNQRGSSVSIGKTHERKAEGLRWARRMSWESPPLAPVFLRNDKNHFFLRLSFPLVTILYLVLWFGMLAVWQHRKARLLKLHSVPLP